MAKEREGRSERGVTNFIRSLCKDGMGLSNETVDRVLKIIKNAGELSQAKKHIRTMGGMTYKRFNQALDMAEEADAKERGDSGEEKVEDKSAEKKVEKKVEKKEVK